MQEPARVQRRGCGTRVVPLRVDAGNHATGTTRGAAESGEPTACARAIADPSVPLCSGSRKLPASPSDQSFCRFLSDSFAIHANAGCDGNIDEIRAASLHQIRNTTPLTHATAIVGHHRSAPLQRF